MSLTEIKNLLQTGNAEQIRLLFVAVNELREKLSGFDLDGEKLYLDLKNVYFKQWGIK